MTRNDQTTTQSKEKTDVLNHLVENPLLAIRELNNRRFYNFLKFFWPEVSSESFQDNWHIPFLCDELQIIAERVATKQRNPYDLLINIPPGTTKTMICSIMFPAWCWTQWHWMRFITVSYSSALSLESAEYSRDLIRSDRYRALYPEYEIKQDKDTKGNFRVVKLIPSTPGHCPRQIAGGNRFSTSVGGTVTGYHAHIIIWDDPLNPQQAVSETELKNVNQWMSQTLPTRKVSKTVSATIGIMQRLHENDPTGNLLERKKDKIRHICLPGEIKNYKHKVSPQHMIDNYINDLFDVNRLDQKVLNDLEADLGQYGYAGQIGQDPTPPAGGMFKVDHFAMIERMPAEVNIVDTVRYWDKAGTKEQLDRDNKAAYTVGCKIVKLKNDQYIVVDVKRGRWSSDERERIIKETARADGIDCTVWVEQEPGSGGKESAENTIRNLAGFKINKELPKGDKIYRADPYSVQVNYGNIMLLKGEWNHQFIEEHRHFPFSTYKDQVDAAGGAFAKLTGKRRARVY